MLELLKYDFFQNALISTLLIGISCGLVGTYIVAKESSYQTDPSQNEWYSSAAESPTLLSAA